MAPRPPLRATAAAAGVVLLASAARLGAHLAGAAPPAPRPPRAATAATQPALAATVAPLPLPLTPPSTTTTAPPVRVVPHAASRSAPVRYSPGCWPAVGMAPRNPTEACISAREHGGCYDRSANPSHFGRWQFDRATWAGNTGSPADWGYASPAEQDRVFVYAVAHGGYARWTRYDGC